MVFTKEYYIQLILKILTLLMAVNVVTPFIDGSIYFWFLFIVTVIFHCYFIIFNYKEYFKKYFWFILFFLLCIFSAFLNREYNNIYSIIKPLNMAIIVFNMISFKYYDSEFEFKYIGYSIVLYTFVLAIYSFFSYNLLNMVSVLDFDRYSGVYLNPNQAAFWAFISFMISVKYIKNNKLFFILNIIFQLILIVFSECRSVYLALIVFFMLTLFFKNNKKISKKIVLIFIVLFLLIVLFTLFRYRWIYKYVSNFDEGFLNVVSGLRYYLWKDALKIFNRNIFFGVGVDNLKYASLSVLDKNSFFVSGGWEDCHNLIITTLCYTGIFGFISFSKIIYSSLKNIFNDSFYFIFIICLLVISLLDIGIVFDNRILSVMFWYLVGISFNKGYKSYVEN